MRSVNKFRAICAVCGKTTSPGEGYVQKFRRAWRVEHMTCADAVIFERRTQSREFEDEGHPEEEAD